LSVLAGGTLVARHGGAAAACAVMLAAHVLSSGLTMLALRLVNALPSGVAEMYSLVVAGGIGFGFLGYWRVSGALGLGGAPLILAFTALLAGGLIRIARPHGMAFGISDLRLAFAGAAGRGW